MKILVVDDEKLIRDSLRALLSIHQFDVEVASNAVEARDLAAEFQPDGVVLDWYLGNEKDHPQKNGLELASALQQIVPAARIVIVSGNAHVREQIPPGARFRVLMKPFQLPELLAVLDHDDRQQALGVEPVLENRETPLAFRATSLDFHRIYWNDLHLRASLIQIGEGDQQPTNQILTIHS